MSRGRYPLELHIRTITVGFASAARTHLLRGDERALRAAFDRAEQLLDSLATDEPAERAQLLAARDVLLQMYRHHLEACDMDVASASGEAMDG
jgi:hypothetical protein